MSNSPKQMSDADIAELLVSCPDALDSPRAIQWSDLTAEQQAILPEGADPLTVLEASASDTTGGVCPATCFAPRRQPAIPLYPQIPQIPPQIPQFPPQFPQH